jgi:hypothetical protein
VYTVIRQRPDICQLDLLFVRFDLGEGSQCQTTPRTMSDHIEVDGQRFCGSLQPTNRSQYFAPPNLQPYRFRTIRFDRPQLEVFFEGRFGAGYGFQLRGKQVSCASDRGAANHSDSSMSRTRNGYTAHLEEIIDRPEPVHISQPTAPRSHSRVPIEHSNAGPANSYTAMNVRFNRSSTNFVLPASERTLQRPDPSTSAHDTVQLSTAEKNAFGRPDPILIESPKVDMEPMISVQGTYSMRPDPIESHRPLPNERRTTELPPQERPNPPINDRTSNPENNPMHSKPATNESSMNDPTTRPSTTQTRPETVADMLGSSKPMVQSSHRQPDRSSIGHGTVQITSNRDSNGNPNQEVHLKLDHPPHPINSSTNVHVYIPPTSNPVIVQSPSGPTNSPPPSIRNETNRFNITNYQVIGWQPNAHNQSGGSSSSTVRPYGLRASGGIGGYCDQLLDVSNFQIRSPNHPNAYPPELFCTYVIRRQSIQICAIELTFVHFELPETRDCNATYLDVDGGRLCGRLPTYHQRKFAFHLLRS